MKLKITAKTKLEIEIESQLASQCGSVFCITHSQQCVGMLLMIVWVVSWWIYPKTRIRVSVRS